MSGSGNNPQDFIYCQQCGQELLATANFCDNCGSHINATPPPQQQPPTATPAEPASDDSGWGTGAKALAVIGGIVVTLILALVIYSFVLGLASAQHINAGEDAWSGERSASTTSVKVSGTATLDEGEYIARSFNPDLGAYLRIDAATEYGGAVDIFVMDREKLDVYANRENHFYYSSLSETGVRSEMLHGTLSSGDYAIVIDNTPVFGAQPDGTVTVDVTITASL